MSTQPAYAIEMLGVTRRFGRQQAVRDLTLRVPVGSTFGFIGPNGAGKSTTIKMLMGLLNMTAGEARVLGVDVAADPLTMRRRVGYVPETPTIYRSMRVEDVLALCRPFYPEWNDVRCGELLRLFELNLDKRVKHLSKGGLAKLSLLIALAHEPEVLILDEPTAGLDPLMREEFLDGVLRSLCDRPRTVLFSSHTLSDVQRLADTVGIIDQGQLVAVCPTDTLVSGTKRLRAVLRDGAAIAAPPPGTIWQATRGREWLLTVRDFAAPLLETMRRDYPVQSVEVQDVGLEEVFKDFIRGRRATA